MDPRHVGRASPRRPVWGITLQPQPPHIRKTYEQTYGRKTVEFALFWSILGHISSGIFVHVFALYVGAGVTCAFLKFFDQGDKARYGHVYLQFGVSTTPESN